MTDYDWDSYFLGMAKYVAKKGTCPTKKVGAVIVDSDTHTMLSIGYNGSPRGTAHCGPECSNRKIGENSKACKAVHAELNAILNGSFSGVRLRGGRLYVTISPCLSCARAIIQSGITEVICSAKSPYDRAINLLSEANIKFKIITALGFPKVTVQYPAV